MKIIISRTDSIGDVILTLPLCGWIKKNIPNSSIIFLCQKLTVDIIRNSNNVDDVYIWDGSLPQADVIIHVFPNRQIARAAKNNRIKTRVGTSHRFFHLNTCNRLIHFTRIKSELHESQLNFKLLKGMGHITIPTLEEMPELIAWKPKRKKALDYISKTKFNLIFHMKSRGSAKEWEANNYLNLAKSLPKEKFNIILTGTRHEGELIRNDVQEIFELENITDTTGRLSLEELISLIKNADGLLACSTGPLHIAGVSNINCLGLYPNKKPMHSGRWMPLGEKISVLTELDGQQEKYLNISTEKVMTRIIDWVDEE